MKQSVLVCTYNIHGGRDQALRPSLARIADELRAAGPDVCLLQEVDRFLPRSGFQDQAAFLARALDATCFFFGRLRLGRAGFGNAILSRLPVHEVQRLDLPGGGEPRCALGVILDQGLSVWNTHLGLQPTWRQAQLDALGARVPSEGPLLVGGDFNATLEEESLHSFAQTTHLVALSNAEPTFPATAPQHRIDLLLGRGLTRQDAGTREGRGSDHRLVWAQVEVETP